MDTPLSARTVITALLAQGPLEGERLLQEATAMMGASPSPSEWRSALIDLAGAGTISRQIIRDDEENVLGVEFSLPDNT